MLTTTNDDDLDILYAHQLAFHLGELKRAQKKWFKHLDSREGIFHNLI